MTARNKNANQVCSCPCGRQEKPGWLQFQNTLMFIASTPTVGSRDLKLIIPSRPIQAVMLDHEDKVENYREEAEAKLSGIPKDQQPFI